MPLQARKGYNPKRRVESSADLSIETRRVLAARAAYTGNPEHKMYPNDYGLTPPSSPRPGKTLCDAVSPFPKADAEFLLKDGFMKGMVSVQRRKGWPQNVWAVSAAGAPFEAQLENSDQGHYHGYPMPHDDEFRDVVLAEWAVR